MLEINKIHCGDSAELMKELPDNFIEFADLEEIYNFYNLRRAK